MLFAAKMFGLVEIKMFDASALWGKAKRRAGSSVIVGESKSSDGGGVGDWHPIESHCRALA